MTCLPTSTSRRWRIVWTWLLTVAFSIRGLFQNTNRYDEELIRRREADNDDDPSLPINKTIGLPIIVVGMPKVGTTTIKEYFRCSKRYRVSHHVCKPGVKCGVTIKNNVEAGRPPLFGISNFDVYTQLDAWALKNYNYHCYMPQVEDIEKLHAQFPNATFILNTRNVGKWIRSLHNYNRGNMLQQMVKCNITGLPAGVGWDDADLKAFYEGHMNNIQSFVKSHPSHELVSVDIEWWNAGETMEEAFHINRTCWGHANKS